MLVATTVCYESEVGRWCLAGSDKDLLGMKQHAFNLKGARVRKVNAVGIRLSTCMYCIPHARAGADLSVSVLKGKPCTLGAVWKVSCTPLLPSHRASHLCFSLMMIDDD